VSLEPESTPPTRLVDPFQRVISYLRVSVTDRCNLRCVYCMPEEGIEFQPREEILSYEEILAIVRVGASMGLCKVRLTGGEPLVRHGIADLVAMINGVPGIEDISLTTNGIALPRMAEPLARAGLRRVNISLDTLRPERFHEITRWGRYEDVVEGIAAARQAGLSPIKINVVVMRQINDDEVLDFARSTYEQDWDLRFIELMPFLEEQETCIKDTSLVLGFVPTEEIKQQIERELGPLEPSQTKVGHGPARYFKLAGAKGNVGFISPVSEKHFCESCNRMRLTADGKIRPCLLTDHEVDVKSILRPDGRPSGRGGGDDEALREGILEALRTKPDAHHLTDGNRPRRRKMIQIGG
jgi:cyclic pyranopterin phosphate synthase